MWKVNAQTIKMTEGDYGIDLPITISGVTFSSSDSVMFTLKTADNGNTIFTKDYTNISNNTVNLNLTEQESSMLSPGDYVYSLDWYQNDLFLCNIIPTAAFKVVDKA